MTEQRSYRDFVPNRFRDVKPAILTPAPGAVVITSRGAFVVDADGKHQPRGVPGSDVRGIQPRA